MQIIEFRQRKKTIAYVKTIVFIWLRHTISTKSSNRQFFVTSFQISSNRKKTITYDLIVE